MGHVEKYGLFAVVTAAVLGGSVFLQGCGGETDAPAAAQTTMRAPTVVPRSGPPPAVAPPPRREPITYTIPQVVDTQTAFSFDEPAVSYPGEHSASRERAEAAAPGAATKAPAGAKPQPVVHVVASGDTLTEISRKYFGTTTLWTQIVAANPGVDPDRLKIGQALTIPVAPGTVPGTGTTPAPATAPAAASAGRTHTVVAGDTLSELAARYLGSSALADQLYAANRDVLKSPDALRVGQTLRIP